MFVCDGVKTFPDFSCDESGKCIQTQRERHRREYDECNILSSNVTYFLSTFEPETCRPSQLKAGLTITTTL